MNAEERIAKRNRPQVIIMLVAFPLLCAFGVYSLIWLAERDAMMETTNRGDFVDPPVLARELGLSDGSGMPVGWPRRLVGVAGSCGLFGGVRAIA